MLVTVLGNMESKEGCGPGPGNSSSTNGEQPSEQESTYEQQKGETTPPGSLGERDETPMETEEELIARGIDTGRGGP
jgi:hypothetical protein